MGEQEESKYPVPEMKHKMSNEKYKGRKMRRSQAIITVVLAAAFAVGISAREKLPLINEDNKELDRSGKVLTSFAPVIKDVRNSVVSIETSEKVTMRTTRMRSPFSDPFFREFFGDPFGGEVPQGNQVRRGLGSGVIVSSNGYILTNNHVVAGSDSIQVELTHTRKKYEAEIVGTDPATDIAVLKIEADNLPAVTFTDSDRIEIGDIVMAIGNPLGVGQTVTMGIVGATGRSELSDLQIDYQSFIQTDAAINRGNSGGALVDAYGRLVGINTAIASPSGGSDGLGFAIPSNLARSVMKTLVEHGKMVRGYLGVMIQDVTSEISDYFDLDEAKGALVGQVIEDSPADKAGLKEGDIVVAINGVEVEGKDAFRARVAQTPPNETIELKVIRKGKEREISATLETLDERDAYAGGAPWQRGKTEPALQGLSVSELDPSIKQQYRIPRQIQGVIITGIEPDSRLAQSRLSVGDVIISVNQVPVRDLDDMAEALARSEERSGKVLLRVLAAQSGYRASSYIVVSPK